MKAIPQSLRWVLLALFSLPSLAAESGDGGERMLEKAQQRFAAADLNHDGKLTLEEAKSGMPRVASNFSQIDQQGKGYLTLADIGTYVQQLRNAKGTPATGNQR